MSLPVRLLFIGDLHLGRTPSGFGNGQLADKLRPDQVWLRAVRSAVEAEVEAVLIGGDIVDRKTDYTEVRDVFVNGLSRLREAGVSVYSVTGNHDFNLTENRPGLDSNKCQVLGEGGNWERIKIQAGDGDSIYVDGWSYNRPGLVKNPLNDHQLPVTSKPLVGLLHAEVVDEIQRKDRVSTGELRHSGHDAWLLGHTHHPRIHSRVPLVLEGGLIQPLEPKDTGERGCWLIEVTGANEIEANLIPLMSVQYTDLRIKLMVSGDNSLLESLSGRIKSKINQLGNLADTVKATGLNLQVQTTAEVAARLNQTNNMAKKLRRQMGVISQGGHSYSIASFELEVR